MRRNEYSALAQVSSPAVLTPAYGRVYKDAEDMLQGWKDGKDFWIVSMRTYTSIRDMRYLVKEFSSIILIQRCNGTTLSATATLDNDEE